MIDSVKEDILKILNSIIEIIRSREFNKLKELSNHTIHSASIFQDEDSTSIAVITYALAKVLISCDRSKIEAIYRDIELMHKELREDDFESYKLGMKALFKTISETNVNLRQYIEEVVQYAEIKKGVKVYEHGISMARAAELLGISEWDLMDYVGKTTLIDSEEEDEKERLAFTRKLFGLVR